MFNKGLTYVGIEEFLFLLWSCLSISHLELVYHWRSPDHYSLELHSTFPFFHWYFFQMEGFDNCNKSLGNPEMCSISLMAAKLVRLNILLHFSYDRAGGSVRTNFSSLSNPLTSQVSLNMSIFTFMVCYFKQHSTLVYLRHV